MSTPTHVFAIGNNLPSTLMPSAPKEVPSHDATAGCDTSVAKPGAGPPCAQFEFRGLRGEGSSSQAVHVKLDTSLWGFHRFSGSGIEYASALGSS